MSETRILIDTTTVPVEPEDQVHTDDAHPNVPTPADDSPMAIEQADGSAGRETDQGPAGTEPEGVDAATVEPGAGGRETDESETSEAETGGSESDESGIGTADSTEPGPARRLFSDLGLSDAVLRAVAEMGYRHPTPIQDQAIPFVLMGRDVLGVAQTGTGKTAGFTLPMLDILSGSRARARMPRSLILEPTRELALQVSENLLQYGKHLKLTHALIIGGESMSDQKDLLMRGVDVLIATPGRLIDIFDRGAMLLTDARLLVIDEADRMLDMGFIPDVERIVSLLPRNRQTLFFSATMAPEIRRLADAFLRNPKEITVSRPASVATTIKEALVLVAEHDKREALRHMIRTENVQSALIFCNRKRDVDILHKSLTRHKFSVGALHGDMAQSVRFATLEKFKASEIRLLVCSDVAARGIDIGGLSHVFNFDVPHHAEDYVHRIGRTGRAGLEGHAFSIATPEDRFNVEAIEKLTGHPIPFVALEGLDPVEWSDDSSKGRRKRGGRTATKAAPKTTEKPAAKSRKPTKEIVPATEGKDADAPAPRAAARAPRPALRRRTPDPREAPVPEPRPTEACAGDREQDGRREWRRRDDDLGPSVVGFGDDVPAFLLVQSRAGRAAKTSTRTVAVQADDED